MAIKGKRKYTIYLTEEDADLVRKYVELHDSSLSDWLDTNVRSFARLLKREGFEEYLSKFDQMSGAERIWFMRDFLNPPLEPPEEEYPPDPEEDDFA